MNPPTQSTGLARWLYTSPPERKMPKEVQRAIAFAKM